MGVGQNWALGNGAAQSYFGLAQIAVWQSRHSLIVVVTVAVIADAIADVVSGLETLRIAAARV